MERRKFQKRPDKLITAVQIDLVTEGFSYQKWGATQRCKSGDWLVDNDGECYTVDGETFLATYAEESTGRFRKIAVVWAEVVEHDGQVKTKEGISHYKAGDYLISNDENGDDSWCVSPEKFLAMYEPVD